MPQVRLPVVGNLLRTFGLLALGAAAAVVIDWIRRRSPFESTVGGPLVLARTDGVLLRGSFRVTPFGPDRQLRWTRIGTHDGSGLENWQFGGLSLRADGAVFAVSMIEYFAGGFDMRVTVHDSLTGAALVSASDNSHPATVWRGDEADIPALLREEQARLDAEWEEWRKVDPDVARPVAQARFDDPAADGELLSGGWTAAGRCLLIGRSRLEISTDVYGTQVTELAHWWGVAGPVADGRWAWIERGHGTPPTVHAAVPTPPLARNVTLLDGQLLVDGVVQTDADLSAGVLAVDGPFA